MLALRRRRALRGEPPDLWPRVPQDCSWSVPLLAHDPDGDQVKCSFAADAAVPLNVSLDQVGSFHVDLKLEFAG